MSSSVAVPRGWPEERRAIYAAGQQIRWSAKRPALFWRGGETHPMRRVYAQALTESPAKAVLPKHVATDVSLCGSHCTLSQGVPPEAWCAHQQLLSLPGHSFAVGFKYTLLCSSLIVRGAHAAGCDAATCPRVFEQFWHAGLSAAEHFASSRTVDDLAGAVRDADRRADAPLVAARSGDYAYHVLDPEFITEYWHALLLAGYATLFDWDGFATQSTHEVCERPHRAAPINPSERACLRGPRGGCWFKLFGASDAGWVDVPRPHEMALDCNSTGGMQSLYRRFARLVPHRFLGTANVSELAAKAYQQWEAGSHKKAPREQ